jgi:hypothetical protein
VIKENDKEKDAMV